MPENADLPYCGAAPIPGNLAWNSDPFLIAALLAIAALYGWSCTRTGGPNRRESASFGLGWTLTAAALLSPLCNLSVALFSARVGQHMLLALGAAPLIAAGGLGKALTCFMPCRIGAAAVLHRPAWPTLAFAAALWFWHMPGPYDATLASTPVYWLMHVTTFAAAIVLWQMLLGGDENSGAPARAVAALVTTLQMSLLGAILTFAATPLFAVHFGTTAPWGLTPLEDQELGGLIMWVPGGLLLAIYSIVMLWLWLERMEKPRPASAP